MEEQDRHEPVHDQGREEEEGATSPDPASRLPSIVVRPVRGSLLHFAALLVALFSRSYP